MQQSSVSMSTTRSVQDTQNSTRKRGKAKRKAKSPLSVDSEVDSGHIDTSTRTIPSSAVQVNKRTACDNTCWYVTPVTPVQTLPYINSVSSEMNTPVANFQQSYPFGLQQSPQGTPIFAMGSPIGTQQTLTTPPSSQSILAWATQLIDDVKSIKSSVPKIENIEKD